MRERLLARGREEQQRPAPVPLVGRAFDQPRVDGEAGQPAGPWLVDVEERGDLGHGGGLVGQCVEQFVDGVRQRGLRASPRQTSQRSPLLGAPHRDHGRLDRGDLRGLVGWLEHLHDLLETHFEQTLGVDRRVWQVHNVLSRGSRTRGELTGALMPFRSAGGPAVGDVLAGLAARGWVAESEDMMTLTETGRTVHG